MLISKFLPVVLFASSIMALPILAGVPRAPPGETKNLVEAPEAMINMAKRATQGSYSEQEVQEFIEQLAEALGKDAITKRNLEEALLEKRSFFEDFFRGLVRITDGKGDAPTVVGGSEGHRSDEPTPITKRNIFEDFFRGLVRITDGKGDAPTVVGGSEGHRSDEPTPQYMQ